MATSPNSPSSPSPSDDSPRQHPSPPLPLMAPPPPLALPAPNPSSPSTASRRLPPPCWSHEETDALIDSYRDKWYSLRRGNLRAAHWQEVADAVARLCPDSIPSKTSVQCRHKMEKLRKRYRSELQRALSIPNHKFSSSWVFFKKMDAMEKGPSSSAAAPVDSDGDGAADYGNGNHYYDEDNENGEFSDEGIYNDNKGSSGYMFQNFVSKRPRTGYNGRNYPGSNSNGAGADGFRIRVPGSSPPHSGFRMNKFAKFEETPRAYKSPKFNFSSRDEGFNYSPRISNKGLRTGSRPVSGLSGKRESEGGDEVKGIVQAIQMLGDGFVKMEKMKIETLREIEQMRMDMEMKRTEMILESQQRTIEAFLKGISENDKKCKTES